MHITLLIPVILALQEKQAKKDESESPPLGRGGGGEIDVPSLSQASERWALICTSHAHTSYIQLILSLTHTH